MYLVKLFIVFLIYRQNQVISHFKAMFYGSFVRERDIHIPYVPLEKYLVSKDRNWYRAAAVGISRSEFTRTHGAVSGGQHCEIYLRSRTRSSKQPGVAETTTARARARDAMKEYVNSDRPPCHRRSIPLVRLTLR